MIRNIVSRLQSDWPYPAARTPFYYGWVIAVISTLGFLFSIPGQTMGMAVFADEFIRVLGLSRTELSTAYLFGTLGSALLLTRAGRMYDAYGARTMLVGAALLLSLTLMFISILGWLSSSLAAWLRIELFWISFPLILFGYFGVRLSGQGVLTSASRNVLLVWFEIRRGLVSGFRGVFVSLGFSLAPLLIALLIDSYSWQGALWIMAGAVGIGFTFLALILVRDHPHVAGLAVDGGSLSDPKGTANDVSVDKTVAQARRDPVFWIYAMSLSIHALFGTAVTFHIVAIFNEVGRSREEAFAYFLPQAIVSLSTNLIASAAADRARLKPLLIVMLMAFILGAIGLTRLDSSLGYVMLVAGFGIGGGLWGVLSNLAFIRQFGALHLGEISGLNTAFTVFASAIGPVLFSLGNDIYGSFDAAAYGCLGALCLLMVFAIFLRQPRDLVPY